MEKFTDLPKPFLKTLRRAEEIESKIVQYKARCVIDALPYPNVPQKLAQKYRGKVFVHYFDQDQKNTGIVKWGEGDKLQVVRADRTKIIDLLVSEFVNKEITFNITLTQLEQYISDWTQLYRDIEENVQGIRKPVWKTIEGRRDHYAFATIYWRVALDKTFAGGAVIRTPSKRDRTRQAPVVSPEKTIPAISLEEVKQRALRGKKDWRIL